MVAPHEVSDLLLSSFFQFMMCQLKMEAKVCLGKDLELRDSGARKMWTKYEPFVRPGLGGREKWMPYHTVLGNHELFIVREVHHAKVACWDDHRRFQAMFIFRAHCKGDVFMEAQKPLMSDDAFWKDPSSHFDVGGSVYDAMLAFRREGKRPLQTQAFRAIPARLCEDDDENLVRNISLRTQTLLKVAEGVWPIIHDASKPADDKFQEISAEVRKGRGLGDTWVKMIMVSIDILFPDLNLLVDRCDVGVGASGGLRMLFPVGFNDSTQALEVLTKASNTSEVASVKKFWKFLPVVEKMARGKFIDLREVERQLTTPVGRLSAVTLQVQLCEWRQFKEQRARVRVSKRLTGIRGGGDTPAVQVRRRRRSPEPAQRLPPVPCPVAPSSGVGGERKAEATKFRIGCVGDSCTYGTGLALGDEYPAQLLRLLEARGPVGGYDVQAFGRTGATAGDGPKSYLATKHCDRALAFKADAYAVMLGTNDAWHADNPELAEAGLTKVISRLREAQPGCSIVLVLPPGAKEPGSKCAVSMACLVHPAVERVAKAEGLPLLRPFLPPDTAYLKDRVHLSPLGARSVADVVSEALFPIAQKAHDAAAAAVIEVHICALLSDDHWDNWCEKLEPSTTILEVTRLWADDHFVPPADVFLQPLERLIVEKLLLSNHIGDLCCKEAHAKRRLIFQADPLTTELGAGEPLPVREDTVASSGSKDLESPSSMAASGEEVLKFQDANPKKLHTEAWVRYERYKRASSMVEALKLGANKVDVQHDLKKGYCHALTPRRQV